MCDISAPRISNIASLMTNESCGSADCPWLLEAGPGQTIRISMIDFTRDFHKEEVWKPPFPIGFTRIDSSQIESRNFSRAPRPRPCHVYAWIKVRFGASILLKPCIQGL